MISMLQRATPVNVRELENYPRLDAPNSIIIESLGSYIGIEKDHLEVKDNPLQKGILKTLI